MTPSNRLFEAIINRNERAALAALDGQDILPATAVEYLGNTLTLHFIVASYASDEVVNAFIDRLPFSARAYSNMAWQSNADWDAFCETLARTGRLSAIRKLNESGSLHGRQYAKLMEAAIETHHEPLTDYLKDFTWFSVNNRMDNKAVLDKAIEADDAAWFKYLLDNEVWTNVYFDEEETETLFYRAVTKGAWRIAERIITHYSGRVPTGMRPDKAVKAFAFIIDRYNVMRPETNEQADIVAYGILRNNDENIISKNVKITLGDPVSSCIDQGLVRTMKRAINNRLFDFSKKTRDELLLSAMRSEHFNIRMVELLAISNLENNTPEVFNEQTPASRDLARHTAIMMLIDGQEYQSDEVYGLLGDSVPITERVDLVLAQFESDKERRDTILMTMNMLARTVNGLAPYGETLTLGGDKPRNYNTEMRALFDDMLLKHSHILPHNLKDKLLQVALCAGLNNYESLLLEGADPNFVDNSNALNALNMAVTQSAADNGYWEKGFETLKAYGLDPLTLLQNIDKSNNFLKSPNITLIEHPDLLKQQLESGFYIPLKPGEFPPDFKPSEKVALESLSLILNHQQSLRVDCPIESKQSDPVFVSTFLQDLFEMEVDKPDDFELLSLHIQRKNVFPGNGVVDMTAEDIAINLIKSLPAAKMLEHESQFNPQTNRFANYAVSSLDSGAGAGKYLQMLRNTPASPDKPVVFTNKNGETATADSFGVYLMRETWHNLVGNGYDTENPLRQVKSNLSRLAPLYDFSGICHDDGRSVPFYALTMGCEVFHELRDTMKPESFNVIDSQQESVFDLLPNSDDESFWRYRQMTAVRMNRQQKYMGKIMTRLLHSEDTQPEIVDRIHGNMDRLIVNDEARAEINRGLLKYGQPQKRRANARL